jgi:hypothetical protein
MAAAIAPLIHSDTDFSLARAAASIRFISKLLNRTGTMRPLASPLGSFGRPILGLAFLGIFELLNADSGAFAKIGDDRRRLFDWKVAGHVLIVIHKQMRMQMFLWYNKGEGEVNRLPETDDGKTAESKIDPPASPPVCSAWSISEIKRKLHESKAKHEQENATDKAARRTADATVWIAAFTVILALVGIFTLYEIITGGNDTHELAESAKKQATASVQQVSVMAALAIAAKLQSDQAIAQTTKMGESLAKTDSLIKATKTIADNARDSLKVSQRAYVTVGRKDGVVTEFVIPSDHRIDTGILMYFQNNGHLPAKFNWGLTYDPVVVPPIPGFPEINAPHRFTPMTRTINHTDGSRGESGGVIIGGDSTYSTDLGNLPTASAL